MTKPVGRPGNPGLPYKTETYSVRLEPRQVKWLDAETKRRRLTNRSHMLRAIIDEAQGGNSSG